MSGLLLTGIAFLGGAPSASATCGTDTVVVYGPAQIDGAGSSVWMSMLDNFATTTSWGRRYIVEVVNGSTRVAGLIVSVDGQQFVGSGELGKFTSSLTRVISDVADGSQYHDLEIAVIGNWGSYATVRICHVSDPTFRVYGYKTFSRLSPIAVERDSFLLGSHATAPWWLRAINGAPEGTNRVTNATLDLNGTPVLAPYDLGSGIATVSRNVTLLWDQYAEDVENKLQVLNQSALGTHFRAEIRATDWTPPALAVTAPTEGLVTQAGSVTVSGWVADETPVTVTIGGGTPIKTNSTFSQSYGLAADGNYTILVHAANSACLSTEVVRHVARDNLPPTLTIDRPGVNFTPLDSTFVTIAGSWADTTMTVVTLDGDTIGTGRYGTISIPQYPLDFGSNRIVFRAVDALGRTTTVTRFVFRKNGNGPTPEDSTLASSTADPSEVEPFRESVRFLFDGADPIQTGVVMDSIHADRAAVVSGRVVARDFGPFASCTLSVLNHPEYGQTVSRANGRFDLAVDGGQQLTLRVRMANFIEAQRQVTPPVLDYTVVDDVAMIGKTVRKTVVNFASTTGVGVAVGRFASDANGDRDLKLFFPPGTQVKVPRGAPGDTAVFSAGRVRATEFTMGPDGPMAMPALLPPGSAYTYCVDLSLDEADSLAQPGAPMPGAVFTKPVIAYLRNFLHFPVGTPVPSGYYDPKAGRWKEDRDGVIVKIVSAAGDTARLDTNGDGTADGQARLDSLGVIAEELIGLLDEYAVGDDLWRVTLDHFSPRDFNFNEARLAADASAAGQRAARPQGLESCPSLGQGSVIECENRVLGEELPIAGSPFTLNYRSYRVPGDASMRTLRIPVSGATVPAGVDAIIVQVDVAGQRLRPPPRPPNPNQVASVTWNGLDAFGRKVVGSVTARVGIGYRYAMMYRAGSGARSFGSGSANGGDLAAPGGDRNLNRIVWSRQTVSLGAPSLEAAGLGGWTISPHHVYDPNGLGTLYKGDGSLILGERMPLARWRFTGGAICTSIPDSFSLPNLQATPTGLAFGPDGSLYIADDCRGAIWRVGRDGIARQIAGMEQRGPYGGDGPARGTRLQDITGLAVAADGSVYLSTKVTSVANNNRILRVTPDGQIKKIVGGTWVPHGSGDGGPVENATISDPYAIACGPDGSIVFSDRGVSDNRVRRIMPNGTITTIAGSGGYPGGGNDSTGVATAISLQDINALAVDADGNVYLAEPTNHRVRMVRPDGIMTNIASGVQSEFNPGHIALGPDGAIYVSSYVSGAASPNNAVWRCAADGTRMIVAGGGTDGGEGIPAHSYQMNNPGALAVRPNGELLVANLRIIERFARTLGNSAEGGLAVPSLDGSEVYYFSLGGRHLYTRDALTGAVRFRFTYSGGRLVTIHDMNGDATVIERTNGVPQAIVAPYGQRTPVSLQNGYLATVANPKGETVTLSYGGDEGLLTGLRDARQNQYTFGYGADGRLDLDQDPEGGRQTLSINYSGLTRTVTRNTLEGVETSYAVTDLLDGTRQRRITEEPGLRTAMSDSTDGLARVLLPTGVLVKDSLRAEPRFGLVAPIPRLHTERFPSGLTRTVEVTRPYSAANFNPPGTQGTWREEMVVNSRPPYVSTFNTSVNPRLLTLTSPANRVVTATVDSAGRPITVTVSGLAAVTHSYNGRGRLTETVQGGRAVRYGYDALGRLSEARDTLGRMTTFAYDSADRVVEQRLPGGRVVAFGYDANGNLTALTPPGRPAHGFAHTPVNLVEEYAPPDIGLPEERTQYTYNLDRQLKEVLRPDGGTVVLGYDGAGRLDNVTLPRGVVDLTYDAQGRLGTLVSPDTVTLSHGYNGMMDTVTTWSGKVTGSVSVALDRDFRVSSQRVNGGNSVGFGYDADGLLIAVGGLTIARRADNGLISGTTLGSVTTSESQTNVGEPWRVDARFGATPLWEATYGRDSLGRITSVSETVLGVTKVKGYAYSDSGFLRTVTEDGAVTERYAYDGNGNRLRFERAAGADTSTGTYDQQDRLLRYKNTRYTYTAAGELATAVTGTDTTRYTYDPLGNLVTVRLPGGDRIDYLIDGQQRRVGRKLNGVLERRWLYQDQLEPVAELNGAGTLISRFVYGSRPHVPDYLVKGGLTYRTVADHLGSVRLVVDAATGAVAQRMDYDGYGRVVLDTNAGFQPFGYAGGLTDSATSLVRFGARDYDARLGRWTSKDPLRFRAGDGGLYNYAMGLPVTLVDVDGLDVWIEGPVSGEPRGHLSVNVGDPMGAYDSYSFGHVGGVGGQVYPDPLLGGAIPRGSYLKTTEAGDRAVGTYLRNYLDERGNYFAQRTCRGWVVDRFNAIVGQGFGEFGEPPARAPPTGSPSPSPPLSSGSTLPGPRKP